MKDPNSPWNARLPTMFFIALTVLFCFVASHADASEWVNPPTTEPTSSPMIASLEPVALAYWHARGIYPPTPVEVYRTDPGHISLAAPRCTNWAKTIPGALHG